MTQHKTPKTTIKFKVTPDLKAELVQLAASRHITLSALLRLVLTDYIKHKK
jgi:antitoxin component of RelBE/YafQ-DinJ toxin-antitoxin module